MYQNMSAIWMDWVALNQKDGWAVLGFLVVVGLVLVMKPPPWLPSLVAALWNRKIRRLRVAVADKHLKAGLRTMLANELHVSLLMSWMQVGNRNIVHQLYKVVRAEKGRIPLNFFRKSSQYIKEVNGQLVLALCMWGYITGRSVVGFFVLIFGFISLFLGYTFVVIEVAALERFLYLLGAVFYGSFACFLWFNGLTWGKVKKIKAILARANARQDVF